MSWTPFRGSATKTRAPGERILDFKNETEGSGVPSKKMHGQGYVGHPDYLEGTVILRFS